MLRLIMRFDNEVCLANDNVKPSSLNNIIQIEDVFQTYKLLLPKILLKMTISITTFRCHLASIRFLFADTLQVKCFLEFCIEVRSINKKSPTIGGTISFFPQ